MLAGHQAQVFYIDYVLSPKFAEDVREFERQQNSGDE